MLRPSRARSFLNGVRAASGTDETATRQLVELQQHILSLYVLLAANACALAYTHYAFAPSILTLWLPGALTVTCVLRAVHWWRLRPLDHTEVEAVRRLRQTTALTAILSIGFVCWALALDGYGGPFE